MCSANASKLNSITLDDGARAEIQQALSQDLEVTIHENPISIDGWSGSGYAIIDSGMGVGAYKISGGASGGFADVVVASIITLFGLIIAPAFFTGATVATMLLAGVAFLNFVFWSMSLRSSDNNAAFNVNNLAAVLGLGGGYALLKLGLGFSVIPLIVFYEGIMLALGAP